MSRNTDAFFEEPFAGVPALKNGTCLLEIKFDDFLPVFIRGLVNVGDLFRVTFSKYAAGGVYY